jgi:hypothetical protein
VWQRRGIPFLGLCRLRRRELVDGNCCWSRTRFWVVDCGEWTTKRDKPPFGLVASARGWLVVERNGTTTPMVGRIVPCTQPIDSYN